MFWRNTIQQCGDVFSESQSVESNVKCYDRHQLLRDDDERAQSCPRLQQALPISVRDEDERSRSLCPRWKRPLTIILRQQQASKPLKCWFCSQNWATMNSRYSARETEKWPTANGDIYHSFVYLKSEIRDYRQINDYSEIFLANENVSITKEKV